MIFSPVFLALLAMFLKNDVTEDSSDSSVSTVSMVVAVSPVGLTQVAKHSSVPRLVIKPVPIQASFVGK